MRAFLALPAASQKRGWGLFLIAFQLKAVSQTIRQMIGLQDYKGQLNSHWYLLSKKYVLLSCKIGMYSVAPPGLFPFIHYY
ncbi:hypothetical protein H9L05_09150 [Hymenobacter qilianensis]|uniref:Uncharacterized protein n=1 Tax=Hymenobacter qilianensis TaxID=1385715 RepID=A0A7H0GZG9_9BACT|nr:hypothetical protein [Hymenobacter qilianensis]QNP53685.1 hypothetical protein H9L05_09150 [Hymenobacter qilianensis]